MDSSIRGTRGVFKSFDCNGTLFKLDFPPRQSGWCQFIHLSEGLLQHKVTLSCQHQLPCAHLFTQMKSSSGVNQSKESASLRKQCNDPCHSQNQIAWFMFISVTVSCLHGVYGKGYSILDQNYLIYTTYRRLNCSKTLLFTAAHTYIPYMQEP